MELPEGLDALKRKLLAERGFHAELYKEKCLRRRVEVRMRLRGIESFPGYIELLDAEPEEYERLMDTLTINVTKFFRNWETWQVIRREIVPKLARGMGPTRIWSAGCASGEEPYSMAMMFREWAAAEGRESDLQTLEILGTDIDRRSLLAAEEGSYQPLSFDEMPDELRDRWFHAGPPYRIRDELREGVHFARSDVISDPPPGEQSLILCRNVLIYFERSVQERLFRTFYDSLVPGGFLILGRVETLLGLPRSLFRAVSPRERIYQKPG